MKWIAGFFTLIFLSASMAAFPQESVPESDIIKNPALLSTAQPHDVVYGDLDAPVRLVEYASLSCSHCKGFHEEILSKIKDSVIASGKAVLIYRHFPLNRPGFRAAQLVQCIKDDAMKKRFIDALFMTQSDWAYNSEWADEATEPQALEKIVTIARIGGMDEAQIEACMNNEEEEQALLARMIEASRDLNISGTPTLFINGEKFNLAKTVDNIERAVEDAR